MDVFFVLFCRDAACSVRMVLWLVFSRHGAVSLWLFDYFCRDAACSVRIVVRVGVFIFLLSDAARSVPTAQTGWAEVFRL